LCLTPPESGLEIGLFLGFFVPKNKPTNRFPIIFWFGLQVGKVGKNIAASVLLKIRHKNYQLCDMLHAGYNGTKIIPKMVLV